MKKTILSLSPSRFFMALILLAAVLSFLPSAYALERPFPQSAKRGTLRVLEFPAIVLNGHPRKLAPGAKIRNIDNLIQTPASLIGAEYIVNYTENLDGNIHLVWILTPDEVRKRAPGEQPRATNNNRSGNNGFAVGEPHP